MENYLGERVLLPNDPQYPKMTATEWAIEYITRWGSIDGDHHKAWVLDQALQILFGTPVEVSLAEWANGTQEIRTQLGKPSRAYMDFLEMNPDHSKGIAP